MGTSSSRGSRKASAAAPKTQKTQRGSGATTKNTPSSQNDQIAHLELQKIYVFPCHLSKRFPHLQELYLSSNEICSLPESLAAFSCLAVLDLSYNELTAISATTLAPLTALSRLELGGNKLNSLPDDLFLCNQQLESLGLEENILSTLPSSLYTCDRLQTLSLSGNCLSEPVSFRQLTQLKNVLLGGNMAAAGVIGSKMSSVLSCSCTTSCEHVSHAFVDITDDGDGENIQQLRFPPSLLSLSWQCASMQHHQLGFLAPLESLTKLNLDNNRITILPPRILFPLKSLRYLFMSSNSTKSLSDPCFPMDSPPPLQDLDLSFNELTTIPTSIFSLTSSLRSLDLSYNALSINDCSSYHYRPLTCLEELRVHGNIDAAHPQRLRALSSEYSTLMGSGQVAPALSLVGASLFPHTTPSRKGVSLCLGRSLRGMGGEKLPPTVWGFTKATPTTDTSRPVEVYMKKSILLRGPFPLMLWILGHEYQHVDQMRRHESSGLVWDLEEREFLAYAWMVLHKTPREAGLPPLCFQDRKNFMDQAMAHYDRLNHTKKKALAPLVLRMQSDVSLGPGVAWERLLRDN